MNNKIPTDRMIKNYINKIHSSIIPWCKQTGKKISEIPSTIDGKTNPDYFFILQLRKYKHLLPQEIIDELDSYGMVWTSRPTLSLEEKARQILIPWCENTGKKISEIHFYGENKKVNPLYNIVYDLRKNKASLSPELIALLDKHGMPWESSRTTNFDEMIAKKFLPWCEKENVCLADYINDPQKDKKVYQVLQNIIKRKDELSQHTIEILNKHGMIWEINKKKLVLESKVREILIPWCEETGKKIPEIKQNMDGKRYHPLYKIVYDLRKHKDLLSQEIIDLLNKYGMVWEFKTYSFDDYAEQVITWCEENNSTIPDIKPNLPNGKSNKYYKIVLKLRKNKSLISPKLLQQLNALQIQKTSYHPRTSADDEAAELLAWCKANNLTICEISPLDENGKPNRMYRLARKLRKMKDILSRKSVELLTINGINFDERKKNRKHSAVERRIVNELIPYCQQNNILISQIPRYNPDGSNNKLYLFVNYLKTRHDNLNPKIIALLNSYGMIWSSNTEFERNIVKTLIPYCRSFNCTIYDLCSSKLFSARDQRVKLARELIKKLETQPESISESVKDMLVTYGCLGKTKTMSEGKLVAKMIDKNKHEQENISDDDKIKEEYYKTHPTAEEKQAQTAIFDEAIKRVISWCDKRIKYIYDITPNPKNKKDNPISVYYDYLLLRDNADLLTAKQVETLNDYGMVWNEGRTARTVEEEAYHQKILKVIYWCRANKTTIDKIPVSASCLIGTEPIYVFVQKLATKKDNLFPDQVVLLEQHGIVWAGEVKHTTYIVKPS